MRLAALLVLLVACDAPETGTIAGPPPPEYQVRIAESTIGANGHTKRELFAFGRTSAGAYADDDVILAVNPPTAGTITKSALTLGPLGARSYFVPCDQASAGCLGQAQITLALEANPTQVIASTNIELVAPTHVSTAAPCRGSHNVAYLDGNGYIRDGMLTVSEISTKYVTELPKDISIEYAPARVTQGLGWTIHVESYQLNAPLAVGIYTDVVRANSTTPGHAGLAVYGNGRGCNTVSGAFEIHDLVFNGAKLMSATISFEQHCDNIDLLEGCFRYAP